MRSISSFDLKEEYGGLTSDEVDYELIWLRLFYWRKYFGDKNPKPYGLKAGDTNTRFFHRMAPIESSIIWVLLWLMGLVIIPWRI